MNMTYNLLDMSRCMEILRGYRLRANLHRILGRYWVGQILVPRSERYYGRPFQTGQGVIQGDPVSSTIFNKIVNAVAQEMLREVCRPQEDLRGLEWAERESRKWGSMHTMASLQGEIQYWCRGICQHSCGCLSGWVYTQNLGRPSP